jgi:periplasmic nitrate reductase NapD
MSEPPFSKSNVDRREFLNGRWAIPTPDRTNGSCEIASILVRAKPERLQAAARTIAALPGTQIYDLDPKGKIIVVIEARDVGSIGTTLNTISLMPDVLSASLVFHGTDEG